jgi:hypothetical protein
LGEGWGSGPGWMDGWMGTERGIIKEGKRGRGRAGVGGITGVGWVLVWH